LIVFFGKSPILIALHVCATFTIKVGAFKVTLIVKKKKIKGFFTINFFAMKAGAFKVTPTFLITVDLVVLPLQIKKTNKKSKLIVGDSSPLFCSWPKTIEKNKK